MNPARTRRLSSGEKTTSEWTVTIGAKIECIELHQARLRTLTKRFRYRLDTNFAKMDRIVHPGIEAFKKRVLDSKVHDVSVSAWASLLGSDDDARIEAALQERFAIGDVNAADLFR
jgi:hypothetical protein